MTDELSKCVCECGHEPELHYLSQGGCGIQGCGCKWHREKIYRARIAALTLAVGERDETIKVLSRELRSKCLDVHYSQKHVGSFWECNNPICAGVPRYLIAETAPATETE